MAVESIRNAMQRMAKAEVRIEITKLIESFSTVGAARYRLADELVATISSHL